MPLTRHTKKIGVVDFTENGVHTLSIPRDGVLTEMRVRLQFTVTNGGTAAVTPKWYALAALFKRIEVILNGRDTVMSIDGPGAVARAIYEYGEMPYGMADTVVLTGSAATAYDVVIPLPFFLPQSADPLRSALPVNRFSQATLEITWGDIDDIYGTANAAAISGVTCSVEGDYMLDVNPERPFLARILDQKVVDLNATSDAFDITIDTGTGLFYRSLNVVTLDDGEPTNAILAAGSLSLEAGTFTFQKRDAPFLQADNALRFGRSAPQTGVYYLHAEKFGNPAMWINTSRDVMHADLKLILDAAKQAGTNTVKVYREAIRPFKA